MDASVAALRRAFDEAFARPPAGPTAEEGVLAMRVGGIPFAARLSELSGLHGRCRIVPLPGSLPGRLGLVGLRGRLVTVYSLAALLDLPSDDEERWLMACRGAALALAFAEFEGQLRVLPSEWIPADEGERASPYVRHLLKGNGGVRAVLDVPSLVAECERRAGPG